MDKKTYLRIRAFLELETDSSKGNTHKQTLDSEYITYLHTMQCKADSGLPVKYVGFPEYEETKILNAMNAYVSKASSWGDVPF